VFDFRLGRGPKGFLGQFEGILQTDGYTAYDQIGGKRMVHAACWAHARRQFFEAAQLNPRDPVATPIVARMDELFAIDAEARRTGLTIAARQVRRQKTAKNLLDDIRSKIEAAHSVALPSSALSKACQYKDAQGALRRASIKTTADVYVQQIPESVRAAINSRTRAILAKQHGVFTKPASATCPNVSQLEKAVNASA